MENHNWKEEGFLTNLTKKESIIVEKYLNEIDFNSLQENSIIEIEIIPVIRRIIMVIISTNKKIQNRIIHDNARGITTDDILPLVNVKEITKLLIEYSRVFIPYAEKYLPDLDAQAEMLLLFCNNYVMKLINKTEKWQ
jgi:hypothetical protein